MIRLLVIGVPLFAAVVICGKSSRVSDIALAALLVGLAMTGIILETSD